MKKPLTRDGLEGFGSLITVAGTNTCLGDLLDAREHGVFDAVYGRVPVTPAEAEAHIRALDKARLDAMDTNCGVGQHGGPAYFDEARGRITFFGGAFVSDVIRKRGRVLTFLRKERKFRGWLRDGGSLWFKRIS